LYDNQNKKMSAEPHQFKDQNEKIAYINTQVAAQ